MTHRLSLDRFRRGRRWARTGGFSLAELMISLLLGLIVLAGVIMMFRSNEQVSLANQELGSVEDQVRTAFEMMSADIRSSGNTPCGAPAVNVVNVVDNTTTAPDVNNLNNIAAAPALWWLNWNNPVVGFDGGSAAPFAAFGTGVGQRSAGTSAVAMIGTDPTTFEPITGSSPSTVNAVQIPAGSNPFSVGDIVMACSPVQGGIFQVQSTAASLTIGSTTGAGVYYGVGCAGGGLCNCSSFLGGTSSSGCQNALGNGDAGQNMYTFTNGSQIARLMPTAWYVGPNSAGTTSLWHVVYSNVGGTITAKNQEIVRGVTGMTLQYQQESDAAGGTWENAAAVTGWGSVDAVQVQLTVQSTSPTASQQGYDVAPVTRTFTSVTTIRNKAF